MKFRHPNTARLSSTSGHVAIVGPEWRPLPIDLHQEALVKGCECDQGSIRTATKIEPGKSEQAVVPMDEEAAIRKALISMVERNDADDFTGAGTPNLNTLTKEVGFKVEKQMALGVWHQLEADAQAAAEAEVEPAVPAGLVE